MTQATDLGAIAYVPGAAFRTRVNAGFQAVASWHYGPSAPAPTYPLMVWADQSTGTVWQRDVANTAWAAIGVLGPPFTWTAVAAAAGGGASTGDVKATFRAAADDGWVLMDDGSIGTAGSGATSRANTDCEDLFTLLWGNVANAWAPVQDATGAPVGRGASAAADWAASRRLVLPRMLGRAIACAGWGADLSDRALGERVGAETHQLSVDEMPSHGHTPTLGNAGNHRHGFASSPTSEFGGAVMAGPGSQLYSGYAGEHTHPLTIAATGGGQPHSILQPTSFLNFQIKL